VAVGRLQADHSPELEPARAAARRLADAAGRLDRETAAALAAGDRARLDAVSLRLIAAERAFVDPEGIPGRPWYRHQIYAPKYTYGPQVLPAVASAVESRDASQVAAQARRLCRRAGPCGGGAVDRSEDTRTLVRSRIQLTVRGHDRQHVQGSLGGAARSRHTRTPAKPCGGGTRRAGRRPLVVPLPGGAAALSEALGSPRTFGRAFILLEATRILTRTRLREPGHRRPATPVRRVSHPGA